MLNEIMIQPNQTVELYNNASTSADISSWYIDDSGGTTYFTIPPQTIVPPQSCFLFSSDFNFNKSTADMVRLFDNSAPPLSSSAKLIEQYSYSKAPDINYSFSKKTDGGTEWITTPSSLGLSNELLQSCIPPTPTPLPTETPIPSLEQQSLSPTEKPLQPNLIPEVNYKNIFISEVYPYPQLNEHEWIELYNDNDSSVDLEHWYIDDGENSGSAPKLIGLKITPFSYASIDISSSLFNNGGDVVRLLDGDKNEKDSMEYGKITQGKSMGRILFAEDSYCEQDPSKNSKNNSCSASPMKETRVQLSSIAPQQKQTTFPQSKTVTGILKQNITTKYVYQEADLTNQTGEVLGLSTSQEYTTSVIPYLSFISLSCSLLTIASVFIKMKNASV